MTSMVPLAPRGSRINLLIRPFLELPDDDTETWVDRPCRSRAVAIFRLVPYRLFRLAWSRFHQFETRPGIFYIHPWEIDDRQPRIRGASRLAKFRHYVNISRVPTRLQHLLIDFEWARIDEVFAAELAAVGR